MTSQVADELKLFLFHLQLYVAYFEGYECEIVPIWYMSYKEAWWRHKSRH